MTPKGTHFGVKIKFSNQAFWLNLFLLDILWIEAFLIFLDFDRSSKFKFENFLIFFSASFYAFIVWPYFSSLFQRAAFLTWHDFEFRSPRSMARRNLRRNRHRQHHHWSFKNLLLQKSFIRNFFIPISKCICQIIFKVQPSEKSKTISFDK